jgi:translation factor GUF1, mitochondrial
MLIRLQIDLPASNPERCIAQMKVTFGIRPEDVLAISAKTGAGINEVLYAIISRIPPPTGSMTAPTKALLFDSS